MDFKQKLENLVDQMFNLISTTEITFLTNLDRRIEINKNGKFNYHTFWIDNLNIWSFLQSLEDRKIYTLIIFLSKNAKPDEPYIILSRQILITTKSNNILIRRYISTRFNETIDLYGIDSFEDWQITFKYKEIKFDLNKSYKFK